MAKFADLEKYIRDKGDDAALAGAGALLKTAMSGGSLEEYGKAVIGAVIDSYVPGISKMLFQEEDPMAMQTQLLLDAIADLEETMIRLEGDGWAEFRTAEKNDIKTKLETARDAIRNWNLTYAPNGGWSTSATLTLHAQIDRLTYVLNQIEVAVKTPGSAGELAPYPYASLIEVYTEVMQLYLLTNPNYLARAAANDFGVDSRQDWTSATDSTKQNIDNQAAVSTEAIMEATIEDALTFAEQISQLDPYRARAAWAVSERPVKAWFSTVECDADTEYVRAELRRQLGLLIKEIPYPPLPDVVFSYTSKSMDTDYSTEEQKHCIIHNGFGAGWYSTYDGFATLYETVDEAYAAHQKGAYNQLLRVGWGPFAITLDKWWQSLRDQGLRTGLRPALALDRRLVDYLTSAEGPGATTKTAVFALGAYSDRQPTAQEKVLFVDYALEYGPETLFRVVTEALQHDRIFFPTLTGYPMEDRLRFVTEVRDPERMTDYYKSLAVARMIPLL